MLAGKYLNRYDLKTLLGSWGVSKLREDIDHLICDIAGGEQSPQTTYYGAVALNGAGIRYFGDFCLVLGPDDSRADLMLITNSYDVHRDPIQKSMQPGLLKQNR